MLNINYGRNKELLNACKPLKDYSWLVDRIRYYKELTGDIETAVDMAIREMPEESVIKSFLMNHKAEVKHMCITEYDEVKTKNMFKEEGREEGRVERRAAMLMNIYNSQKNGIITIEQAAAIAGMSVEEFEQKMTISKI